jgi:hypothetical protein
VSEKIGEEIEKHDRHSGERNNQNCEQTRHFVPALAYPRISTSTT